jgi:hypothetical protein
VGVGYPAQVMNCSSTLRGEMGASILWYCVHGSFATRGVEGEEEYLYHWLRGTGEVFMVSQRERGGSASIK